MSSAPLLIPPTPAMAPSPSTSLSPSSAPTTPASPLPPSAFPALSPDDLPAVLADPHALILDIRPHNAHAAARIPGALSLSVPSTLLKRPTFALARLAPMLPAPASRARFAGWASAARILVYDSDAPGLAERPALLGLLRKFRAEGFPHAREVAWLRGGFNTVWRERPDLLDHTPPPDDDAEEDELGELLSPPALTVTPGLVLPSGLPEDMSRSTSAPAHMSTFGSHKVLRTKGLSKIAFLEPSTMAPPRAFRGAGSSSQVPETPTVTSASMIDPFATISTTATPTPGPSLLASRAKSAGAPPGSLAFNLKLPGMSRTSGSIAAPQRAGAPGAFAGGEETQSFPTMAGASSMPTLSPVGYPSGMSGQSRPMHHSMPYTRPVAVNPFFDTIRQNLELARGAESVGERGAGIALRLPRRVRRRVGDLPFEWLREIARRSGKAKEGSSSDDSGEEGWSEGESQNQTVNGAKEVSTPRREVPPSLGYAPYVQQHMGAKLVLPATLRALEPRSTSPPTSPPQSPSKKKHVSPTHSRQNSYSHGRAHSQSNPEPRILVQPHPVPADSPHRQKRRQRAKPKPLVESESMSSPAGESSAETSQSPSGADELTRALELQFYRIELGEQRRLMGVMEHHSMESATGLGQGHSVVGGAVGGFSVSAAGVVAVSPNVVRGGAKVGNEREGGEEAKAKVVFPFSITAGLEKGNKNRRIWPFEHARVRLRKVHPDDDDYMNASYVQPLGTKKRYIATQGPLPTTFTDFWTLCWEQNVHVIVMLTREVEGAAVKSGKYWEGSEFGPLRLKLLATDDTPERERYRRESEMNAGFFGAHAAAQKRRQPKRKDGEDEHRSIVRRIFQLKHTGHPNAPPRIVTQLQYLEWPDMNVPDDPHGVLRLIREVEEAVARARVAGDRCWGEGPLHQGPWPARLSVPTPSPPRSDAGTPEDSILEGDNEVEPTTGIARRALRNPPVLLHCSAGVGRTGGFIAVDAILDGVRREMRKRKEETQAAAAALAGSGGASGDASGSASGSRMTDSRSRSTQSGSGSGSSSRGEPMEVDSSPSPPASSEAAAPSVSELTVPVSVGESEVHVRVAGFAQSVPMEVDDSKRRMGIQGEGDKSKSRRSGKSAGSASGGRQDAPRTVVPASTELLDEVRRATMFRLPSASSTATSNTTKTQDTSETGSSDSYRAPSGLESGSGSGTSIIRSRSSTSPPSSQTGSATSLSAAMTSKTAQMSLRSPSKSALVDAPAPVKLAGSREGAFALPPAASASSSPEEKDPPPSQHASRLDTWRSEVQTSGSPPREDVDPRSSSKSPEVSERSPDDQVRAEETPGQSMYFQRGKTVDYAQPRQLHEDWSPPLLSTFDEPVRRVIEDMREQRMSLCQSLRQYVFVHRAIIEGALMVVDEERDRERQRRERNVADSVSEEDETEVRHSRGSSEAMDLESSAGDHKGNSTGRVKRIHRLEDPFVQADKEVARKRSLSDFMRQDAVVYDQYHQAGAASMISPGRQKRGASPTELQKEGKSGEVMLTKRPSVKRKPLSDESSVEFELMPPTSAR
ncbi:uncharacterized protein FIBRA_08910 [Fibroporia radiculosa]|uniref:protein-tyrosine-phosphatase n=1 Tax=Fibroporia radiculosa TaxID=599839 RepID=J4GXL9_9APHY|nr:uncharacterized protein FIBRA_08910 [Fibroporia radiculosa]CCM06630.1 predicted protein [Fibroporia radiculosa]